MWDGIDNISTMINTDFDLQAVSIVDMITQPSCFRKARRRARESKDKIQTEKELVEKYRYSSIMVQPYLGRTRIRKNKVPFQPAPYQF